MMSLRKKPAPAPNRKINAQQMMRVIARQAPVSADEMTPEYKLMLAVIGQAVRDLTFGNFYTGARHFFNGSVFRYYCSALGMSAQATRELLVRGGFLLVDGALT